MPVPFHVIGRKNNDKHTDGADDQREQNAQPVDGEVEMDAQPRHPFQGEKPWGADTGVRLQAEPNENGQRHQRAQVLGCRLA